MSLVRSVSGYLVCLSAQDTLYGPSACTTAAAFNAGSEFRLVVAVGRAPAVVRGPEGGEDGLTFAETACLDVAKGWSYRREFFRTLIRRSLFKIWKSFHQHRCARESGDIGRRRQAGAAVHACTDYEARKVPAKSSGSGGKPSDLPLFQSPPVTSARCPPRGAAARRNKGARGELFPPHAFPVFPAFSFFYREK